jgi:hypothetical protein
MGRSSGRKVVTSADLSEEPEAAYGGIFSLEITPE